MFSAVRGVEIAFRLPYERQDDAVARVVTDIRRSRPEVGQPVRYVRQCVRLSANLARGPPMPSPGGEAARRPATAGCRRAGGMGEGCGWQCGWEALPQRLPCCLNSPSTWP